MRHDPGLEARRPWRVMVAAIATLLLVAGCKGGSSSSNDVLPCTNISFTPALTSPASGDVYLQAIGACDHIDVLVQVNNLSGIWTVGFDLTYPASALSYQGTYFEGPVLKQGSPATPPFFYVISPSAGSLQVTITRWPPDPSVTVSGLGSLITIRLNKVASGGGLVDFDMSGSSTVSEQILDEYSSPRPASFGPDHGGTVVVP